MDKWPEFLKHPHCMDIDTEDGVGVVLTREQYNQARDAIAWRNKATEIYPNVSTYIDEIIAGHTPQPTGDL